MEIVKDVKENEKVKEIFETQGHAAEHNMHHYINMSATYGSCIFAIFENKYGIMGFEDGDVIWCYSDPLAPEKKKPEILLEFLDWMLNNGKEKLRSEINEKLWKSVAEIIKNKYGGLYRAVKPSYIYYWPVYALNKWNPNVSGIRLKKIRNAKNRFYKEHKVELVDKNSVSKQETISLVQKWKTMRGGNDHTKTGHYISAVESGFAGYDSVRFVIVDGILGAINGGWGIQNSNNFYSQLGIINYEIKDIGEISYIEDLNFLKQAGYEFADFGGSTPNMIVFKKKFLPAYIYRTVEFSVVLK